MIRRSLTLCGCLIGHPEGASVVRDPCVGYTSCLPEAGGGVANGAGSVGVKGAEETAGHRGLWQ